MKTNKVDCYKRTISFKSIANPVKPFIIKAKPGKLYVNEVSKKDLKNAGFMRKISTFFCENFASTTNDPSWNAVKRMIGNDYDRTILEFTKYYRSKIRLKDKNMTLLLARDKRGKIQGACLSYGCDVIPDTNNTLCYIDSIAVNEKYRNYNIGKVILEKSMESASKIFTDVFLAGDLSALGFYKKMGFKTLNKNDEAQQRIIDYMSFSRFDYPEYVEFLTKPLQNAKTRWFNIINEKNLL